MNLSKYNGIDTVEILLIVLSAAVGMSLAWRGRNQPKAGLELPRSLPTSFVPIVQSGAFRWGRAGSLEVFDKLYVTDQGLAVVTTDRMLEIAFSEIRAVLTSDPTADGLVAMETHVERDNRWGMLVLFLKALDAQALAKLCKRARPDLTFYDHAESGWYTVQLAQQTLEGELTLGADVTLCLVGRTIVVLQGDAVLAKLAASGVRRVIATEQTSTRGLIRLFSATETTLFAADDYISLATHLADQAHSPLDIVTVAERKSKT